MTVHELLNHLHQHLDFGGNGDAEVLVWDCELGEMQPLTTIVTCPSTVELTAEGE